MAALARLLGPTRPIAPGGPPFQGGVAGLAAYELGDRIERLGLERLRPWPDLACGRYSRLLAFDHRDRVVFAIGADLAGAEAARTWLDAQDRQRPTKRLVTRTIGATPAAAHEAAVADIIGRIAAGEIFQANLARSWRGWMRFGCRPFDLFARLVREQSGAVRGLPAAARARAGLQLARAVPAGDAARRRADRRDAADQGHAFRAAQRPPRTSDWSPNWRPPRRTAPRT